MTTGVGKVARATPPQGARSTAAVPVAPQSPDHVPPPAVDGAASGQDDAPEAASQQDGPGVSQAQPDASKSENEPEAQQDEPDAPADVPFEAADAVPRALKIVGSIVAPTTLLTALFVYFGFLYSVSYFRYFGVNYTVLELPNQAFLILSASTATLPLALLTGAALLSLWLYEVPVGTSSGAARWLLSWVWLPAVAVVGLALLGLVAVEVLLRRPVFPAGFLEARGLSLSIGVVLLTYAARLRRALAPGKPAPRVPAQQEPARRDAPPRRSAQQPGVGSPVALTVGKWVCLSVLFGVGLFWAVGSYAMRMGIEGAQGHLAGLRCAPDVVLYSEKSLDLQYAGVWEEWVGPDGAYGFRYPGLKLVPQAGTQYLLLPADWAPGARPAIVLPRSDTLRLEFTTVAPPRPGAC